ncbi:MAG: hypothetical protein A3I78_08215 [Gammaproteobacteria bacterium RIFCSPLOWO2_02_FULL_56_15]|nr:MAG: hypothetical protein A3I78_08215 [Gammaproteobacteria bacterium RIFCSPLOWO2_02_FULL_56_15]
MVMGSPIGIIVIARIMAVCGGMNMACVFILMTVDTKQFPVASVRWVIVVIMIAVMDGQFTQIGTVKVPAATATYPRKHFQRLLPIGKLSLLTVFPGFSHNLIESTVIRGFSVHLISPCLIHYGPR